MGDTAFSRILGRGWRGIKQGWDADNPVGLNPEVWRELQEAGVFRKPGEQLNVLKGLNEIVVGGLAVPLDLAGKLGGAAYQGLGEAAIEAGVPRDVVAMPEAFMGGLGGLGGVAAKAQVAGSYRSGQRASRQFRPGADGSPNLGQIGPEVQAASSGRFPQAPIRMQEGIPGREGYGAAHISPDKHKRAQSLGYSDGFDLIEDVARNHDVVVEQVNGRLMLVKQDGQSRYAIAEYQDGGWRRLIGAGDPYYGVTTGYPDYSRDTRPGRKNNLDRAMENGGRRLWKKNP